MDETNAHLDPRTLYLLQENTLSADEAARARRHLASCGSCRAEAEMARSFVEESGEAIDEATENRMHTAVLSAIGELDAPRPRASRRAPRRPRHSMWWISRGALAAALVVAAFGLWQLRPADPQSPPTGVVRSTNSMDHWKLQLSAVEAGWELQWAAQADARGYTVIVQSASGRTLWQAESEQPSLHLDRIELSKFTENDGSYFVSVLCERAGISESSPALRLPMAH